jgi:hypothetical protein
MDIDVSSPRAINRAEEGMANLNWRDESTFTADERQGLLAAYEATHGFGDLEHCPYPRLFANHDPAALKRSRRQIAMVAVPGEDVPSLVLNMLHSYVKLANPSGILYELIHARAAGHTKAEVMAVIDAGFLHGGPFGANAAAKLGERFMWEWQGDPTTTVYNWPDGWKPDASVFECGLDMSNDDLSAAEHDGIRAWYERVCGEIPVHVDFFGRHNPRLLKATHYRWIKAFGDVLPAKFAATFELQTAALTGDPVGLRLGVKLAHGLGLTQGQVMTVAGWASVFGGPAGLERVATILDGEFHLWNKR